MPFETCGDIETQKMKEIIVLALPGVQLLDLSGPLDVFAEANRIMGRAVYRTQVMGLSLEHITSSSGVKIIPDLTIHEDIAHIDSFLVAGAPNICDYIKDEKLLCAIANLAKQSCRYGSVCCGAILLAHAGILDGHKVTTHWAVATQLAIDFPKVKVEPDAICISDGSLRTAAGVTSGLDLALMMVEEDIGREVALEVSAQLVMFFKRPGGQLQFSRHGGASIQGRTTLQELQRWVISTLDRPHNANTLAEHIGLSTRHLSRLFKQEIKVTPSQWLIQQKISHARHLLESTKFSLKQISALCGFTSVDIFRRAFVRSLKVSPAQYRKNNWNK
ncbi:GlxA family transcriptional regulator [Providencia burhodogranariea]|uniref:AraC family transcriptional regulator n=1 Tax=Providencia burhodogranariea DSM 19968 TaxID=1141662 RepID=K8WYS2_9GAMM|nr:helix-turn-helix domain-containing protein [Providencia burhodogranariea]EKT62537.1 AraC family transcriptional regulator [Providencia burhodogranariea DSM 19968]